MKTQLFCFVCCAFFFSLQAQEPAPAAGGGFEWQRGECVSEAWRAQANAEADKNAAELIAKGKMQAPDGPSIVFFEWPARQASGLGWNSYYGISNYVDQNTGAGTLDYNCGTRTYDGHKGTDIFTWPFSWYLKQNNLVEVIAASAGTIVAKYEGNSDENCSCLNFNHNGVLIQHSDGSRGWYLHMKNGSVTTKGVGQSVAVGEYLGVIASSGCSTGPHVHFEVWANSSSANTVDPYWVSGGCNNYNGSSWWTSQKPYREPTLNVLYVHSAAPVFGCPSSNEAPNFATTITTGQTFYYAAYYHDQTAGQSTSYVIKRPNGTTWNSWNHASGTTYDASYWYWSRTIGNSEPAGTWTFEATYQGQTFVRQFTVVNPLPVTLREFNATDDTRQVQLDWATEVEQENKGFDLQSSSDGQRWEKIAFVAGKNSAAQYQYFDKTPFTGERFYRLAQEDFDGDVHLSPVRRVFRASGQPKLIVSPNPVTDHTLHFQILEAPESEAQIQVTDMTGRICAAQQLNLSKQALYQGVLALNQLPAGVYTLYLRADGRVLQEKIVLR